MDIRSILLIFISLTIAFMGYFAYQEYTNSDVSTDPSPLEAADPESTQETTEEATEVAAIEKSDSLVRTASNPLGSSTDSIADESISTAKPEEISENSDISISAAESSVPEAPRADLIIHINEYPFLPIPDITKDVAKKICAVAAGHLCLWGNEPIQQTRSIGRVLTGEEADFKITRSTNPARPDYLSFPEPQEEQYRAFVIIYDLMGRVYRVEEAHILGANRENGTVTVEWEHQIFRQINDEQIGIKTIDEGIKYNFVIVGTETGRIGIVNYEVAMGSNRRADTVNLRPYVPGYEKYFISWLGYGRLIDGGEGIDTVEYKENSYEVDFLQATTSPRFIRSVYKDETDGEVKTNWFYQHYDSAIAIVGPDSVDVLVNVEIVKFNDNTYSVADLMQMVAAGGGAIYGERGEPSKGIAY